MAMDDTYFVELCEHGSAQDIAEAIKEGANVNARHVLSRATPLMFAASDNDAEAVKTLLDAGADINARDKFGDTALMYAARNNKNSEVFTTLINASFDINARNEHGDMVLMYAALYNKNPEVITTLINAGLDINVKDEFGNTALMRVVEYNENPEVTTLINAGADINARDEYGRTALMRAAEYNDNPEVITTLINAGADINARDEYGRTALMYAAEYNENPEVIATLINAEVDTEVRDRLWRVFMKAAEQGYKSVKEALDRIEKKAGKVARLNSAYSGKYLGDTFTAEQNAAIRAGIFDGMALGDYWTIDGVNWRIADFDYLIRTNKVDASKHHVMIVPDKGLYEARMNSTDTNSGGYAASEMRRSGLDRAKDMIERAFGRENILTDYEVEPMTTEMLSCSGDNSLSLFHFQADFRIVNNYVWCDWLDDVVSAANFAEVNDSDCADLNGASSVRDVRPAFAIY